MKVHIAGNTDFKANYYHYRQLSGEGVIDIITTNNYENLGNEPILITDRERLPMIYDGKYYSASLKYPVSKYKIYYKDTGKYEHGGCTVTIDKDKIAHAVMVNDLKVSGLPLQKDISKGFAEGKVVTSVDSIVEYEPIIYLAGDVAEGSDLIELPPNVVAVIVSDGKIDYLSHISSLSRSYFNLFTILYDENMYEDLKGLEGEYIYITNAEGGLKYKRIEKPSIADNHTSVNIPKILTDKDFLSYDEINERNSGNKAYRLVQVNKLSEQGILSGISVPKGFVISPNYIEKIENFLNKAQTQKERENRFFENPFLKELEEECKNTGINPCLSIIRSAFNAEDLCEYPTAGLYFSDNCYGIDDFILTIDEIYDSKDSPAAIESRKRYGIPDDVIQPSVLVQEYIPTDYNFTAYTDSDKNKVLIELGDSRYAGIKLSPSVITYDDNTKDFNIIEHQVYNNEFLIDNKGNILEKEEGVNPILENWQSLLPALEIISQNALILEKFFEKPQDLEGGVSGGKVYFWQVRDIAKNALKRL